MIALPVVRLVLGAKPESDAAEESALDATDCADDAACDATDEMEESAEERESAAAEDAEPPALVPTLRPEPGPPPETNEVERCDENALPLKPT